MRKALFCIWKNESIESRKNQRNFAIQSLNLSSETIIPIFEQATQIVAQSLKFPVACLGILQEEEYQWKSVYGLSNLGFMNELINTRKISKNDAFATHVIDSNNYLLIENTLNDPFFSSNILTNHYGIIAYLGVPLTLSNGVCIGCLEIIDTQPRIFSEQDINFLQITARWCLAEYERNQLIFAQNSFSEDIKPHNLITQNKEIKTIENLNNISQNNDKSLENLEIYIRKLTFELLNKLTQKLSIPLTSVVGMSSVLRQEIYGKLNTKQSEYLEIIYNSGQEMVTLIDEISRLANLKNEVNLEFIPVNLENLGRQVFQSLEYFIQEKEHSLRLSIEPGEKVWNLDREKVKKTLYYLLITIIESSRNGGEIQVHIAKKTEYLKVSCWVIHSWLGDGIAFEKITNYQSALDKYYKLISDHNYQEFVEISNYDYDLLCLLFSAYLAHIQGGNLMIKGSPESNYRFIISLPINAS